ncbi:hypothetical protein [Desulfovibrio sp. JC022]|uniref:hypothetical protein n=1 Tax=Desulfovibrio sp. JC022 TaxID=2593642 RepID=UPI0013D130D5|nr:hypothetical protein [Desulfovibrio sp. JC022]NDV21294.1 hypothetical protein [Desulfovibrio sp. JC022]
MRIQGFNQSNQMQVGSFKSSNTKDENSTRPEEITTSAADMPPRKISQNSIEFQLERVMRKSADFLKKGLEKIFDNGEQLLAGRNSEEYREHIDELGKAIQGQDFKRAEKLIDKFYNGDTDKIITRLQNLAKAAEDNFWDNIEDGLDFLKKDGLKWTMYIDGKERDDLSTFDLAKMAIEKSRNEVEKFSSEDLSDLVNATRNSAAAHAKGKLKNAGQNKYSEDARSVTHAATEFAKSKIFNTDDSNYEEDQKILKDIDELYYNEGVTEEQLNRLRHQNTRKADKFTKFMRGRTDSFVKELDKLKLAASPRVVEKPDNSQEQVQSTLSPMEQQLKNGVDPQLLSLNVEGMLESSQQNENTEKQAAQYINTYSEDIYPSIDWEI